MSQSNELRNIALENITVSEGNVRKRDLETGIDELAQSIKDIGLLQPVVVFPIPGQKEKYELVIGQRRLKACRKLKLKEIPAIILEKPMNYLETLAYSFAENIHRQELEYKDKTEVALYFLKELGTIKAVARKLDVSETTVRKYLGYAAVPEPIKKMVEKRKLSKFTAIRLSKNIPDPKKAVTIATKIREIPRREDRSKIIEIAVENPEYDANKVFEEAKKTKLQRITLDLTPVAAKALYKASIKYERAPEEIATQVLIDYLKAEGFYKSD